MAGGGKRKRGESDTTGYGSDDTPRAFTWLMQKGKKKRGGLDDGHSQRPKKPKIEQKASSRTDALPTEEIPKILPHERLSDFSARVDQAIPMAGLRRRGKGLLDIGRHQSRKEKKMQNMYADWRRQDAARRTREEEAREIAEEEEEELEADMRASSGYSFKDDKNSKRKRSRKGGDEEEDPWARLKETRDQPRGLHDVAQAPPTFKTIPQEKFKVKNGAKVQTGNVPNTAGSLRRREELEKARNDVIERYRTLQGSRNGK